ncbi:succinylglutamate-semialdehyde dehydrogenase [Croceicoccus naphthovorans]|uniref:Succinylglutamate-semialdehyde dehydrogenase n=1 Tax=Croceicoccus naphthovorans TaxID=1348774 RepID=A0A0G3XHA7_9SPHN|nr:succinylglutamate-semialdehyde dehydrogenase [Croceicoccus naphthovorans]AKM10537.1 succinylglutamate-semialdehyde dehydrogenase [Croceicoccus naphthovorans]MBB3988734.1 succinylglutamic semialdehyde dehydrogenase [Croceicoccus naphthovorans]
MAEMLISREPATGAEFWRGEHGDVDAALSRARAAFPAWAARPLAERAALLERFAELVKEQGDNLATLIARETGKPLWEAKTEVAAVAGKVAISIRAHGERTGERVDDAPGGRSALRHKPHGVMAVLGPYNFPAHLPNGHMVPALLAGNVCVFKPSEKTPAVGEALVALYHQAGMPKDVVQCLIGAVNEGRALTSDPRIDGVLFTGSSTTGVAIGKALAERPGVICALEMGGNNPLVIWDTPRMADAAAIVVQSAYTTAGQRCTAARRLIVKHSVADALLAELLPLIDRIRVGAPFDDPQPYMGPVIDNDAADGLERGYAQLLEKGATVLRPLKQPDPTLPFLTPAIVEVTGLADLPDRELFGPLLQLTRVSDLDTAIAAANDTDYGLSASFVGGTEDEWQRFWRESRAGIVNRNRPTNGASSAAPFGGTGLSGNHRPGAFYAADYCAYPVASAEGDEPEATIATGLKD